MLTLAANALNAVAESAGASTNYSSSAETNAAAPIQTHCGDAADAAPASAVTNLLALTRFDVSTTVSTNDQSFNEDACCSETRTLWNDFTLQADALAKTSRDVSAQKTVRFFSGAVISVGRSGNSARPRDDEFATFDRFSPNVSWAGGDAAARRELRGLKLFSWSW